MNTRGSLKVAIGFLSGLVMVIQPAQADLTSRIVGALSLPSACGIKPAAGGCARATPDLYISSGLEFFQPCQVISTDPPAAVTCNISDHAGSAGRGSVIVDNSDGCHGAAIELAPDPTNTVFLDFLGADSSAGPSSRWRVTGLSLAVTDGEPKGLGYHWTVAAGSIKAQNLADGSVLQLSVNEGEFDSAVSCVQTHPVTGFTMTLSVER